SSTGLPSPHNVVHAPNEAVLRERSLSPAVSVDPVIQAILTTNSSTRWAAASANASTSPWTEEEEEDEALYPRAPHGAMNVQVVRSVCDWINGVLTESSIQEAWCYIQLITEANHFTYWRCTYDLSLKVSASPTPFDDNGTGACPEPVPTGTACPRERPASANQEPASGSVPQTASSAPVLVPAIPASPSTSKPSSAADTPDTPVPSKDNRNQAAVAHRAAAAAALRVRTSSHFALKYALHYLHHPVELTVISPVLKPQLKRLRNYPSTPHFSSTAIWLSSSGSDVNFKNGLLARPRRITQ
ncbi:hypothetical protein K439DRAFT_1625685, partial [Ramaria rubella]